MSSNIIREDVISVGWDIDSNPLIQMQKELDDLKKKLGGGLGDEEFDDLKDSVNGANDSLGDMQKEANKTKDNLGKIKQAAEKLKSKLTDLGKKGFAAFKKIASVSFKAVLAGAGAVATALGKIAYESVQAYGEFEQLKGGMEKIFDQADTSQIMKDANNAYKELGMSASEYLSSINNVGATFAATMGDQKGYETARTGMMAISDYATGTGKDITELSDKFTLITRSTSSYQSIADQFSGILPATSKDFLKQAQAAGYLDKKYSELTKVPVAEYQEAVSKMLEKGVKSLGLAGNTSAEATETLTGSLGMVKAAWSDLKVSMASGVDLDKSVDKMVESAEAFGLQVIPVAEKALLGMGKVVDKLAPVISEKLPELAEKLLPPLIRATISLAKGLIKALPNIIKTVFQTVGDILGEQFPALKSFGNFFAEHADKIAKFIPVLLGIVGAFMAFNKIKSIASIFGGLFGGGKGKGGAKGGMLGGLESLAKMKTTTVLKGMANLAIIFGGMAILTTAFMLVAPALAKIGDTGEFIKVALIMTALGVVGGVLAKFGETAGKIKVTTVLKGLANMAIILAGMSALLLLVSALSLIKFDYGAMMAVIGIISVLGVVGIALTAFAGIAGLIPVATVALGLANMAIMIVGMDALLLLIGATSLIAFDYGRMLKIIGLLALLGTVGGALTIFAGIAGMIPFPIVLLGLANMALVLGAMTGLIIAFGALAKVKGINEFIDYGGELLIKLFNIIGQMAGSLIGGIGEAVSKSLPVIGENLAKFGTNIKPLFEVFKGVDMSGVGQFFSALGSLLLTATGSGIIDGVKKLFGGDSTFATLGNDLSDFGENAKGFFEAVATYPEKGFNNAKLLFDSLSGLSNLPNSGGIGSWFSGEISYTDIASGLEALAGDGVKSFYAMVAGLDAKAFEHAKLFFESIDGLGGLPNSGGLGAWFGGEVDYAKIADGLTALGAEGVKNFFLMAENLSPTAFENTKLLFKSLSGMSKSLPKEDNWWDKLWGTEKQSLGDIAADLESFATKGATFFTMVDKLNIENMNGLWESLKNAGNISVENLDKVFTDGINSLVTKVAELPQKMGDALKNNSSHLSNGFVDMWKEAVKASVAPVNKLLEGANHILKEFGSKKKVIEWTPYANGTGGHKGGNALVNDGNGAELVQMPNGNAFIPHGRNVLMPNAPQGMKVLPADQTAQVMGRSVPTFNYANGTGDIDVWSYYDNAKGLVDKIVEGISYGGMSEFASNVGKSMVSTFAGEMPAWVDKLFEESGQSIGSYVASKGVLQWLPTVVRALKMEGQYSLANVARTLFQMRTESGGNPKAINNWDSNAKKGTPSKGLMQVIDPTFNAYARAGFNKNIYDPLSNILASIRYAVSRYGSLAKAYRGVGYANGGVATKPSVFGEDGAEMAIPLSRDKRKRGLSLWAQTGEMLGLSYTPESSGDEYVTTSVEYNTYSPQLNFTISGSSDDRILARKIKKVVTEALADVIDGAERSNPKLREV